MSSRKSVSIANLEIQPLLSLWTWTVTLSLHEFCTLQKFLDNFTLKCLKINAVACNNDNERVGMSLHAPNIWTISLFRTSDLPV